MAVFGAEVIRPTVAGELVVPRVLFQYFHNTVTRKVAKAARRNRVKRLIREYFRLNRRHLNQNWDINIVAKKKAADLSAEKVFSSLQDLFEQIVNSVD